MTVDWSRQIEAVHDTGLVHAARATPQAGGERWWVTWPANATWSDARGALEPGWHGWRIRNVQPTTPERDPALWDRMVALVRMCAEWKNYVVAPGQDNRLAVAANEARAIVADLPKPVDPDEQYAADLIRAQGWQGEGPIGEAAVLSMIAKAHRDGRELATPEVSHVG